MKIVAAKSVGAQPVYDLSVDHEHHSFVHESGVVMHNCAYVIANRPISEFIPLTTISEVRCTSYTAPSVEAVGGLKMDFLVINSLNDIGQAIKLIQQRSGQTFEETIIKAKRVPKHRQVPIDAHQYSELCDIWDLPEDQAVFADVATGRTETVFQFNTPGAIQWMEHFSHKKPNGNYAIDSIEGMSAFTALDRPGPLDIKVTDPDSRDGEGKHNMLVEYARRARGAAGSPEVLKVFEDILPETFGVMVYQEQLQRAYQQLTGCSGPEAEEFRTLVAKKKMEQVQKLQAPFIAKATDRIGAENARAAWEFFITWGQYGFNKSHSVCYSVIGYACAWLKHHYPLEWWTAVLRNADKNEIADKFWRHCGHLIDLPDVTLSGENFEIQGERLRAPLSLLQGVGAIAHKQLLKYGPYTNIDDFCAKIQQHRVDTGVKVLKTKKQKVKESKRRDPETKKFVYDEIEVEYEDTKFGTSALNRGICRKMILSGAMDSLFEPGMHVGEMLMAFETSLTLHTKQKPKKGDDINPALHLDPIQRYQTRKKILPAFGADLFALVTDTKACSDLSVESHSGLPVYQWLPPNADRYINISVADAKELERRERAPLPQGQSIQVAVVAHIDDTRVFRYGEEKREALELIVNVDGGRFKYVKWAGKAIDLSPQFKAPLKGAVVVVVLNKFKDGRPFAVEDLMVIRPPLGVDIDEEAEDKKEEDRDE